MAASFDRNSDYVQFLNFRPSPSPLQPNNYHFSAPEPRFLCDPLLVQMTPSSTVLATPRGGDQSPLAIHSIVSSRKKSPKRKKMQASKQSRTTFIAADVANFSQMVQHVTGAKFGDSAVMSKTLLGAEPQRAACRGRSYNEARTSCRNDARSSMSAGFSPAAMRMFPELQRAAVRSFGLPPVVVADGGDGRCLTRLRRYTHCSREENSNSE